MPGEKMGRDELREKAAEVFDVDPKTQTEFERGLEEARRVMAQGDEAVAQWLAEGSEEIRRIKREAKELLDMYISTEEARTIFDQQAQSRLGVSGEEFIRKWEAGEYAGLDTPEVMGIAMLIPLYSPPEET